MILVDWQIKELCEKGFIQPYNPNLINPSSIDVRIGVTAMKDNNDSFLKATFIFLSRIGFFDNSFIRKSIFKYSFLFNLIDKIKNEKEYFKEIDFTKYNEYNPYWLMPKKCILISTLESVNLPDNIACTLKLKSSRAREGLDHALAGWVDNGFHGILTLELTNNSGKHAIPIYPGLRIGQLILEMTQTPNKTYKNGRYAGKDKVLGSLD